LATAIAGSIKIVGIIASLAALALVLSPTFSLLQVWSGDSNNHASGSVDDATFLKDDTVTEDVSEDDLSACGSLNSRIEEILTVTNGTVNDRKVASDTLIAEFCSRPVLIHEIMSTDTKALSLVAYACDASTRKIGTAAIQESLSDFRVIYCDSAKKLIVNETNTFLESVEEFRTVYLPLIQGDLEDTENAITSNGTNSLNDSNALDWDSNEIVSSHFNVTSVQITLDSVTQSLEECSELVDAGEYYPAAKSFDNASKKFVKLFQEPSS
jgi:hypothetical protein